uniref:Laminin subunit alpha n=1 Tax=Triatoma infestans TaxID=30076 RepID=A0A170WAG0_TRIIF
MGYYFYPKRNNFMSIEIREGKIFYQFNLGEGLATMFSSETYNDGKWHQVETSRLEKVGVLKVDGKFIEPSFLHLEEIID